jgi:hypothetical protein
VKQLDDAGAFTGPIATTIEPNADFYESMPKVRKLEKYFPEKLKKG